MIRYIEALISLLAYTAYKKMYGIKDRPFKKIEIHLSERDNNWNSIAVTAKTIIDDLSDITINESQPLKISSRNNSWNQLAIKVNSQSKNSIETPNKANSHGAANAAR